MALTYQTTFPVLADADFYACQLNFLQEAIKRRADQVGVTVTLPDTMPDETPIEPDDEPFSDWLDAARTAIEAILTAGKYYAADEGSLEFVLWTKATLLAYVHGNWPTPCTPSDLIDPEDWYQKTGVNEHYIAYINEVYYALECLVYHTITTPAASIDGEKRTGDLVTDGEESAPINIETVTVNSATQTGTFDHAVDPDSVFIYFGDDTETGPWIVLGDDGDGGFYAIDEVGCSYVSGSINYETGAWSVVTDTTFAADLPLYEDAQGSEVMGTWENAVAAAMANFLTKSYVDFDDWLAFCQLYVEPSSEGFPLYGAQYTNAKVSDGQVTIADLAWAVTYLYLPYHEEWNEGPTLHPTLTTATLTWDHAVTPEHADHANEGYARLTGDFNNEAVSVGGYYYDIEEEGYEPNPLSSGINSFEIYRTGAFARCGFDGYCNDEYEDAPSGE